jgi:hypothetical protein
MGLGERVYIYYSNGLDNPRLCRWYSKDVCPNKRCGGSRLTTLYTRRVFIRNKGPREKLVFSFLKPYRVLCLNFLEEEADTSHSVNPERGLSSSVGRAPDS